MTGTVYTCLHTKSVPVIFEPPCISAHVTATQCLNKSFSFYYISAHVTTTKFLNKLFSFHYILAHDTATQLLYKFLGCTYHILPQVTETHFLNITVQPPPHYSTGYSNIVPE